MAFKKTGESFHKSSRKYLLNHPWSIVWRGLQISNEATEYLWSSVHMEKFLSGGEAGVGVCIHSIVHVMTNSEN